MAGYPMSNITSKMDEINKHLHGTCYTMDAVWDDFYAWNGKKGKAHIRLLTGPAVGWFDTVMWTIDIDDITAGRLDLKLQEIVKFGDNWKQRLIGLDTEYAIENLQ
jgi:hypothetical protein